MTSTPTSASVALESIIASFAAFGPNPLIPIVQTDDGEIVDGRLRLAALEALGLPSDAIPRVIVSSDASELLWLQLNVFREHLSLSQRAVLATDFENMGQKANDFLAANLQPGDKGRLAAPLGRLLGVSERMVQRARRLVRLAPPELVQEVREGPLTITAALKRLAAEDAPPRADVISTNVTWPAEVHKMLRSNARDVRMSRTGLVVATQRYLYARPEALAEIYQEMHPGAATLPGAPPTPPELAAAPTRAPAHERTREQIAVPATVAVRLPRGTKKVLYARAPAPAHQRPFLVLFINKTNISFKDLWAEPGSRPATGAEAAVESSFTRTGAGASAPTPAPAPAHEAPELEGEPQAAPMSGSSTECATALTGHLAVMEEEKGWSVGELVERYNATCAEWTKRFPEDHQGRGLRPVSRVTESVHEASDRLREGLRARGLDGTLSELQSTLTELQELSPAVIAATHRHTLGMLAKPTKANPERGPFLMNLERYRDWEPVGRPQGTGDTGLGTHEPGLPVASPLTPDPSPEEAESGRFEPWCPPWLEAASAARADLVAETSVERPEEEAWGTLLRPPEDQARPRSCAEGQLEEERTRRNVAGITAALARIGGYSTP